MTTRRIVLARASAAAILGAFSTLTRSQVAQPLHIVVGFPAGVVTDNIARAIADALDRADDHGSVIIENKPGAGGQIAADYVRRAPGDGYTILLTPCFTLTVLPHVYRQLRYNTLTDFKPVAGVASTDYAITVGPAVPETIKTLTDYIQWCRSDPVRAKYGIPGAGSTPHFIGTLLAQATNVAFSAVPYRGGGPLIQDLLGGHIPAIIDPLSNAFAHHQSGRLRILAITSDRRSAVLPNVPTVAELNFNSLTAREVLGVYTSAGVPDSRVQQLHVQIRAAVIKVSHRLAAMQVNVESMGPTELASFTRQEFDRWASVVQASGFKVEE